MTNAIPESYRTLTPHIIVRGAAEAIEFYKRAFGAEVVRQLAGTDGKSVMHAELKIGDSMFMIGEEMPDKCLSPKTTGTTSSTIHIYVENADSAWDKAVKAGAKVEYPLNNMFWGDRYGVLTDPFGHKWSIGQHIEDLTPEEIGRRQKEFFKQTAGACS